MLKNEFYHSQHSLRQALREVELEEQGVKLEEYQQLITDMQPPDMVPESFAAKVIKLVKVLEKFHAERPEKFTGLIFVERRVVALALERFLSTYPHINAALRVGLILGHGSSGVSGGKARFKSDNQAEIISNFRNGKVNLLIATSVAEEGIDIPQCSLIIRFDPCPTLISYIQSRGRARHQQSNFVMLIDRGDLKQMQRMEKLKWEEQQMKKMAEDGSWSLQGTSADILEDDNEGDNQLVEEIDNEVMVIESTGATLSFNSSIPLLQYFCTSLQMEEGFTPVPKYHISHIGPQAFVCRVDMPPGCDIQTMESKICRSKTLSKRSAAFELCRRLHRKRAFDDHLMFTRSFRTKEKVEYSTDMSHLLEGMNMDANDFPDDLGVRPDCEWVALTPWSTVETPVFEETTNFFFYSFASSETAENAGVSVGFVTTREFSWTPAFPLYFPRGNSTLPRQQVQVTPSGKVIALTAEQHNRLKRLSSFCLRYVYLSNRDNIESSPENNNSIEYIVEKCDFDKWDENYAYALAPTKGEGENAQIDWDELEYIETSERIFREATDGNADFVVKQLAKIYPDRQLTPLLVTDLVDYQRRLVVSEIRQDLSPASHIVEEDSKQMKSVFEEGISYEGHYRKNHRSIPYSKRRIREIFPDQPLYHVSRIPAFQSFLVPMSTAEKEKKSPSKLPDHRIPQFLVFNPIPADIFFSLQVLPSIMYQMEAFWQVTEFKKVSPLFEQVKNRYLLEALTASSASFGYDYQRLETLGDAFLKVSVTTHLFLKFTAQQEGSLSYARHLYVSNKALSRRASDKLLHQHIWTTGLSVREWRVAKCGDLGSNMVCIVGLLKSSYAAVQSVYASSVLLSDHTVADVLEALVGAAYMSGGTSLALKVMDFFNIPVPSVDDFNCLGTDVQRVVDDLIAEEKATLKTSGVERVALLDYERLENIIGYKFKHRFLLEQAMNHQSSPHKYIPSYERLEHIGDAVQDFVVVQRLFAINHDSALEFPAFTPNIDSASSIGTLDDSILLSKLPLDPERMTELKKLLVCNDTLAFICSAWGLGDHILMFSQPLSDIVDRFSGWVQSYLRGESKEDENSTYMPWWWIPQYQKKQTFDGLPSDEQYRKYFTREMKVCVETKSIEISPALKSFLPDKFLKTPPNTPKTLSDVFEAIMGAIFLDSDFDMDVVWSSLDKLACCTNNLSPAPKHADTILPIKTENGEVRDKFAVNEKSTSGSAMSYVDWILEQSYDSLRIQMHPLSRLLEWNGEDDDENVLTEHRFPYRIVEHWLSNTCGIDTKLPNQKIFPLESYFKPLARTVTPSTTPFIEPVAGYYLHDTLIGIGKGINYKIARGSAAFQAIKTIIGMASAVLESDEQEDELPSVGAAFHILE
eukprot:Partr_v1_DN28928_c2_g1_i1_m25909 putative Dicer-like endonuclease involved in cleaving double- stranded RNA in the RNA interference (RNAi) pathway. Produces 21 to 25 bp dsRNAs (siRNAs) which target the selective destruction of homologous RNAs leading to sequence-specific suppression of gene expression, called post-transcriptional gene silencing (PTGS). Part of a broad host defense response against viral infection and transposons